jgi:hypothetical protein
MNRITSFGQPMLLSLMANQSVQIADRARDPGQPPDQGVSVASGSGLFAEDFSLLVRTPRRMRIARSTIRVLS